MVKNLSTSPNAAARVVVVNWEKPDLTIECLHSLYVSQQVDILVTLVDNGSRDDSVAKITSRFPQVDMVCLPENLGFSRGYNAGIARALEHEQANIFLLNNDTTLEPDAIKHLLDSNWDVAVPKILYSGDPRRIWAAGCQWRALPPSVKMRGFRQLDSPQYDLPLSLDYATGCALMVRRDVLRTIGGFDPEFVSYMEDYDFSYRVRKAGYSIGYVPQARVYHKISQTLGDNSSARWELLGANTVLFYRKGRRFSAISLWFFLTWVVIREIIKGNMGVLKAYLRGAMRKLRELNSRGIADTS